MAQAVSDLEWPMFCFLNRNCLFKLDHAASLTANSHQSECLDELAAQGACSDHEQVDFAKFLLKFVAVNCNLVVVPALARLSVDFSFGKSLVDIKVEPLPDWGVFSSKLHDLLGNDAAKKGAHWRNR
jgi:hypothetical protein